MRKRSSGGVERAAHAVGRELEACSRPSRARHEDEPSAPRAPHPISIATLCAKDWTYTYFDAKVATPITVCTRPEARLANENNLLFPQNSGRTTFKLTDPRIFADLKDSVLEQPPLVCTINNGPLVSSDCPRANVHRHLLANQYSNYRRHSQ